MLQKTSDTPVPNSFQIKRFVPIGKVEAELARNPSAKVFREIVMTVGKSDVTINLGSVTREAANGGYRNGSINNASVSIPTENFLDAKFDMMQSSMVFQTESYNVMTKINAIRSELTKNKAAAVKVLEIIEST